LTQPPNFPPPRSRPAVRASWLMLAIGVFQILTGALFVAAGYLMPVDQLQPEQAQRLHQLEAQLHASMTTVLVIAGGVVAVMGIYHIAMSFFVARRSRGAIYTTLVNSFLVIGWCAISALGQLLSGDVADAVAGSCFLFMIAGLFVWLIVWLFQALRSSTSTAAMAQYQAQYWQSLQQQQAFAQPPAPGVPPPGGVPFEPPPPPQPPSPEPTGWAYGPQTPPPAPPAGM